MRIATKVSCLYKYLNFDMQNFSKLRPDPYVLQTSTFRADKQHLKSISSLICALVFSFVNHFTCYTCMNANCAILLRLHRHYFWCRCRCDLISNIFQAMKHSVSSHSLPLNHLLLSISLPACMLNTLQHSQPILYSASACVLHIIELPK